MGGFTREFTNLYHFDGDTISVTMRRLKRDEAMSLAPFVSEGEGEISFQDSLEMMAQAANLLPKAIIRLSGLVMDGQEVIYAKEGSQFQEEFKTFCEEMYFLDVISRILSDLISNSFFSEDDKKKSNDSVENTLRDTQVSSTLTSVV